MDKKVIHIFHKPLGLGDQFSKEMGRALSKQLGCDVQIKWLWSPRIYHGLCRRIFTGKLRLHILHDVLTVPFHLLFLRKVKRDDIVIVDGDSKVRPDTKCWFERRIVRNGATYLFYLIDDLLSQPAYCESTERRIRLSSAVIVVTPQLKKKVQEQFPDKPCIVWEEPIDCERVGQITYPDPGATVSVAWTGRMPRAKKFNEMIQEAKESADFSFRVVTGKKRPEMGFPFEWDWRPFCHAREAMSFNGCVAGIANLEDTPYDACKGNYKVKTYMAMGLCPIVSDVGYARDLIKHGETGFLVSSKQDWIDAVRFVVENPHEAIEMGKRARLYILNTYAAEPLAEAWARELKPLL